MTAIPPPDPPTPPPATPPPPTPQPSADGAPPSWQQAPPPPPTAAVPQRPPLRRSTSNKVLGGVCGGLAEYTGVEALLWRIGFVALAFFGAGILVYPLLWILLPAGTASGAAPAPRLRETFQNGRTPGR